MEIMAPKKAATIIPQDPTPIPRLRKRSITKDTASLAPEDIPSTKGLAMGFPKKVWRRKPDTDRAPPSMAAAKSLGRRISHKIRPAGESASIPLKAAAISAADSLTLPNMAFNSKRRIQPKSRKENIRTALKEPASISVCTDRSGLWGLLP